MKKLNWLLLGIVALAPLTGSALTQCKVVIVSQHPFCASLIPYGPIVVSTYAPNKEIIDGDLLANLNASRCLERAQEYQNWCSDPKGTVNPSYTVTYFQVDGLNRQAAVSINNNTYVHDGVARYTRFHD